jgi:hypothetical protein
VGFDRAAARRLSSLETNLKMKIFTDFLHNLEQHEWIKEAGSWVESIDPLVDDPKRFYISGAAHVADTLLWLPPLLFMWLVGILQRNRVYKPKILPYTLSFLDYLIGVALIVCEVASTYYKYDRQPIDVVQMFAPCHVTTMFFIVSIFASSRERAAWAFNIGLYYSFFTLLALAVPDISMLTQPFSVFFFYLHHWLLVLVPLYYIHLDRFPLYCKVSLLFASNKQKLFTSQPINLYFIITFEMKKT